MPTRSDFKFRNRLVADVREATAVLEDAKRALKHFDTQQKKIKHVLFSVQKTDISSETRYQMFNALVRDLRKAGLVFSVFRDGLKSGGISVKLNGRSIPADQLTMLRKLADKVQIHQYADPASYSKRIITNTRYHFKVLTRAQKAA